MDYALHLEALDGWFDDALAKADNVQELRIEQLMIHYKFLSLSAIHTAYWTYGSEKIREEYIKEYDKLISDIEYYKISFGEGLNLEGLYDYGTAPYFLYKYIYQE